MTTSKLPTALTIAGFDPSGGAGVIADLKTFALFGLEGVAAITSLTFQNAAKVFGAVHQTAETVRSQVMPLLETGRIVCAKTGMLPTREVVMEVARLFADSDLPRPVIDPVMVSSSGTALMEAGAVQELVGSLLPLAAVITPNIHEAEMLTGRTITSEADMRAAAARIREMGARAVLVKGGHLERKADDRRQTSDDNDEAIDVLDNQGIVTVFREQRVPHGNLHGSGCILSAAIAAGLGKGMTLEDSVGAAKRFVLSAIAKAQARI